MTGLYLRKKSSSFIRMVSSSVQRIKAQAALKGKTGKYDERNDQINRLKKKVGELTMDREEAT